MNQRLSSIESVFFAARELATPAERAQFLNQACAEDPDARRRIDRMLSAEAELNSFLEAPAVAPTLIQQALLEEPGAQIGPYKLREVLGEGGMGIVYAAEQEQPIRRKVALKLIKPGMDTREVIARFEAERQALALMDHPNIAKIIDAGTTGDGHGARATRQENSLDPQPVALSPHTARPYFVMELVRGLPLTTYCDQAKLPLRDRLKLFVTVCQAVQHAHQKGIIHRDLKPSNVMVTLHDGVPVPKIIDFGVAKALNQRLTDQTVYTRVAQLMGTPMYMSPEQAELSGLDVDTRSDVYSLGVLLYELLTGQTPFDKDAFSKLGYDQVCRMIREDEPPRPSTRISTLAGENRSTIATQRGLDDRHFARTLRGELDWIVMKALEKDRTRRYGSASSLAADVDRFLKDEPVEACPPSAAYWLAKIARRNKAALVASCVVAMALLAGTVVSTWQAVRARQAEQNAKTQRDIAQAQRQFARQAVDKMFSQVADKWLSRNTSLEPVQKQILTDALQIYEELTKEESADPVLLLERGNAYRRIGQIYDKLGNTPESERAFRTAQEILGRFVDQHPSEPDARAALASACHQYAFAMHYSARTKEALEAYRQALLHRERLVADYPGVPRYTREMAVSLGGIANMLNGPGSYPESETAYLRAIQLMDGLPREAANDPDCRFELGLLYSELAIAQNFLGRGEESKSLFYRGKTLYEQLASEFPRDPTYREELAYTLAVEGLERLEDRPDDAEKALRRSLAINLQLAQESPAVPAYQCNLGSRYCDLGGHLERTGRRAEAEEAFRESTRIAEQVLSEFPNWRPPGFSWAFVAANLSLQWMLLGDGRTKEAEAVYLRALEIYSQLRPRWMVSPSSQWTLAQFRWNLAGLACKYDRVQDAAQFSSEAISLYEQAAAEQPKNLECQKTLAARKGELAKVSSCGDAAREIGQ